jgi:hypothetical protein
VRSARGPSRSTEPQGPLGADGGCSRGESNLTGEHGTPPDFTRRSSDEPLSPARDDGRRSGSPRVPLGKDTCSVPGALLTTSNKPDTVETTRKLRDEFCTSWVFDPQQVVDEEPTWWRNPPSSATDDATAAKLAGQTRT